MHSFPRQRRYTSFRVLASGGTCAKQVLGLPHAYEDQPEKERSSLMTTFHALFSDIWSLFITIFHAYVLKKGFGVEDPLPTTKDIISGMDHLTETTPFLIAF